MSVNNTNAYSFKSASSRLSNYKIYGSDKYTANYKIYGNTIDGSSVGDLKNLSNPNDLQQGYYAYADGSSVLGNLGWVCTKKIPCKSNTNYTFSFKNPSRWAGFVWYDSSDTYISTSNRNSGFTNGGYYTAQSPSNAAYFVVNIAGYPDDNASITVDNIIDLMIKKGSTPSEYEPYGYKVPIRVTGKNLLKVGTSQTSDGVTFTVNSDGSVTCNGTASATTFYGTYIHLQKGSYIISGCPQNGSDTSYMISMRDVITGSPYPNINGNDLGNSKLMTITEYLYFKHVIRIASGYTCDNLTFYPMIRRADIEDSTYEPYREEIHNVYLDSPLTKSGDNTDYIDFKEQKRVNIDGTEEYIKLPEFNIESENDSIFIDTDTQPSNVDFDILHGVGDRTENLFDVTKITPGYWINHSTGVLTSAPNSDLSDYIPVSQGATYTLSWSQIGNLYSSSNREYAFFDSNKVFMTGGQLYDIPQNNSCSITIPNGVMYIRFDYDKSFTDIMLNEGTEIIPYKPFYKIPIKVQGKNLFIKPVEQGSITTATGGYNPSNTTRIYSKNIPLIPGKTYTISCNNNLKFRLISSYFNDTYIGQLYLNKWSSTAESQTTITIPENANNISVSFWNGTNSATVIPSDLEWCQIEEGETATEYEEPFNQITNIYLDKPLLKVGDNADYIDYSAQKKYTYNNTVEDMMLPDIPINVGENKLMIDTLIKPSNISISVLNVNDGSIPVDTNNKQEKIKHIFKTTEDTLRNYQIYGSDKYAANYKIYGSNKYTAISENLFDENSTWNTDRCIDPDNTFPGSSQHRTYFMNVAGSTTYKINMTSSGDRLKVVYYDTNIDPTKYTMSNRVTATGVIYNGSTGNTVITSGENLCMTFTTPDQAKMIGIYYSLNILPTGFTITEVKNNSVGNLVNLFDENSEVITLNSIDDAGVLTHNANVDTYDYIPVEPNTIYRAKSFGIGSGSLSIRAAYYDSSKTFISRVISDKNNTFTTPINCMYIRLSIDRKKPIHDLQISLTKGDGDPATYEPYGYKVPIRVTGKNLFKVGPTQTINGVTFTVNSDGSVTCNGTASANTFYAKSLRLQKGSYIISGCPQNGSMSSYIITMRDHAGNYYSGINGDDTGTGKTIITTEYLPFQCIIRIASGYTCDNLTFYPMIRRADIEDSTYEPYREQIEYLYLDSPLTKSGDNCDYIDFKEQKRVNIDGTTEYIKLPEFNISENSSIFVDTDTQPSNIDFDILHGVGDRTENLFDGVFEQGTFGTSPVGSSCNSVKSTIESSPTKHLKRVRTKNLIYVNNSCTVSADFTKYKIYICKFDENQLYTNEYVNWSSSSCTITNAYYILVAVCKKEDGEFTPEEANDVNLMINSGSTALQYEPPYKIPIKVQGKNLFNSSVEQGGLMTSDGTEYTSGRYYTNRLRSDYINLTSNKTYTISSNMKIKMIIAYNENKYISRLLNTDKDLLYSTITLPSNANNIRVVFWSGTNDIAVEPSNFEWGQIEEGEVVTEYEEPFSSTNNIYLNRPLLKDGSDYDYIDYSEQKRYNYDGTIENITIHHVLTNNGMNTLTFDSLVQPLQSFIKYYDEDAETPIVDSSSSFEASFTTSGTQLLNYRIWGTDAGLGNINLFDFDAWWETIKNNVSNGSVKRGKNQSFTITPTGADAFTSMSSAVHSGGYRIYVEPNSSYTWSWNKECANNAYYGRQMIFLDGRSEPGYMFTCTGSTSLTFTTKSDTSFIMLRFGCGTSTDTPITFSNITLSKNNSNPNILINMSDMDDISTWDINLLARPSKTVETNSWVIGQIIDVTNINSLYIVGDTKIVYENNIRVGKSNEQITNGSTLLSYTAFTVLPQIIDTSDCNYIIISVSRYNNYKNTTFEQIKNTFKIYKAPPNTTIITLPRKLYKTDTNIEYIDYESQKLYSTNNVNTDISLPPISTVVGKNKLRIPPDKKPSKLMIKYLT